jgi:histidine triad (HIT) family protein
LSEDCIFCKIVQKQAPASVVYEDDVILAFMDIRPVSEGHTLVIPKHHYRDIFDTPPSLLAATHKIAQKISSPVKKVTNADGISIVQQNGVAAGQDIFHIHVHIIPRFQGRKTPHFRDLTVVDREILDKVAERIKQQF